MTVWHSMQGCVNMRQRRGLWGLNASCGAPVSGVALRTAHCVRRLVLECVLAQTRSPSNTNSPESEFTYTAVATNAATTAGATMPPGT